MVLSYFKCSFLAAHHPNEAESRKLTKAGEKVVNMQEMSKIIESR